MIFYREEIMADFMHNNLIISVHIEGKQKGRYTNTVEICDVESLVIRHRFEYLFNLEIILIELHYPSDINNTSWHMHLYLNNHVNNHRYKNKYYILIRKLEIEVNKIRSNNLCLPQNSLLRSFFLIIIFNLNVSHFWFA